MRIEPVDGHSRELAARTHTPQGWPLETIEIVPSGKAPKTYGPNVYRFGAAASLSEILPRRGWTLVKVTKNYVFLIPPTDGSKPPFHISVAVPTTEEVLAIARRSYAGGVSWMGHLGEWPAWYLHERNMDMRRLTRDPQTGEMVAELLPALPQSNLSIGEWGAWQAQATGVGGDFVSGFLPAGLVAVPPIEPAASTPRKPPLWEGEPVSVELTRYERNTTARRLCLQHYGPTCQACDLTYEDRYGAIGADLIHVHHVTPLAEIGEAYEIDPVCDLVPLCATCHHVAHSRIPPYSVAEIKAAIAAQIVDVTHAGNRASSHPEARTLPHG